MKRTPSNAKRWLLCLSIVVLCGCGEYLTVPPSSDFSSATPAAQLHRKAEKAFQKGSMEEADRLFQSYLDLYPDGPNADEALMRRGDILKQRRQYPQARKAYQTVLDRHPSGPMAPHAMLQILQTHFNEGAYAQVLRKADGFLKALASAGHRAGIYLILGDTYLAQKSAVNAVYFYAMAIEHREKEAPAYLKADVLVGRLKTAIGKLSEPEIISLMERVKNPVSQGHLMYQLGLGEITSGRYADAGRTFTQFLTLYPNHEYAPQAEQFLRDMEIEPPQAQGAENGPVLEGRPTLGCLLPLTGSYQVYGNKALKGVELAVKSAEADINLVIKDSSSDPNTAAQAVSELSQEQALAIIGPIISAESAGAAAQQIGIPLIALTQKAGITNIGEYVFRHFLTPQMQVEALVRHCVTVLNLSRFAILYPNEKYGITFKDIYTQQVQSAGAQMVGAVGYSPEESDFTVSIQSLKSQGAFDALFIPDAPDKVGLIVPQLAFYDVKGVRLLGTNLWNADRLVQTIGKYAQGALFPDIFFARSESPRINGFVQAFEQTYGEPPGFIEALAYDTAQFLIEVLRSPGILGPSDVKEAIINHAGFTGVTGPVRFTASREAEKKLFLLQLEGESVVEVNADPSL